MSAARNAPTRQLLRLLRFLHEVRSARLNAFDDGHSKQAHTLLVAVQHAQRQMLIGSGILQRAKLDDLIVQHGQTCALSDAGKAHLRRARGHQGAGPADNTFAEQHRNTVVDSVLMNGERQSVRRNLNESPLSRLRLRRTKDGTPFLSDAAFAAGERLRADFTHAQLAPSVTSNWSAAMGGGGGVTAAGGGQGGKVALTDSALDAQDRFNRALKSVGPDLSDVLIDVCCYLKGLQQVEREQGWPPRSAKLMLKTGLGLLAQFYGTVPGRKADA